MDTSDSPVDIPAPVITIILLPSGRETDPLHACLGDGEQCYGLLSADVAISCMRFTTPSRVSSSRAFFLGVGASPPSSRTFSLANSCSIDISDPGEGNGVVACKG